MLQAGVITSNRRRRVPRRVERLGQRRTRKIVINGKSSKRMKAVMSRVVGVGMRTVWRGTKGRGMSRRSKGTKRAWRVRSGK
jgi:hypothetical protein